MRVDAVIHMPSLPSGKPTYYPKYNIFAEFYQVTAASAACPCGTENKLIGEGAAIIIKKSDSGVTVRCAGCGAWLHVCLAGEPIPGDVPPPQVRCSGCHALLIEALDPRCGFRIRCGKCKVTNESRGLADLDVKIVLTTRRKL